ncbi:hypothetical protein EYZ11_009373 [Aspergillus tanneri]|uniref:Uncharacterized protein n=1 Tax=Aspergillus tanneri TaxID=1220188 RepID=A0A4S3J892_9EURO|nr:hypothetical protein EYZ11_009373 [Aspergillus tanneri]
MQRIDAPRLPVLKELLSVVAALEIFFFPVVFRNGEGWTIVLGLQPSLYCASCSGIASFQQKSDFGSSSFGNPDRSTTPLSDGDLVIFWNPSDSCGLVVNVSFGIILDISPSRDDTTWGVFHLNWKHDLNPNTTPFLSVIHEYEFAPFTFRKGSEEGVNSRVMLIVIIIIYLVKLARRCRNEAVSKGLWNLPKHLQEAEMLGSRGTLVHCECLSVFDPLRHGGLLLRVGDWYRS